MFNKATDANTFLFQFFSYGYLCRFQYKKKSLTFLYRVVYPAKSSDVYTFR